METTTQTVKPFKSERAAKMAYTKAENAWKTAGASRVRHTEDHLRPWPCVEDSDVGDWADEARAVIAKGKELQSAEDGAFEAMRAIYDQAKTQGFWIDSWHFGHNPTRDLIAANMD